MSKKLQILNPDIFGAIIIWILVNAKYKNIFKVGLNSKSVYCAEMRERIIIRSNIIFANNFSLAFCTYSFYSLLFT